MQDCKNELNLYQFLQANRSANREGKKSISLVRHRDTSKIIVRSLGMCRGLGVVCIRDLCV